MARLIEKFKNLGAALRRNFQSTAKVIAEKTPQVTATLGKKTKALTSEVTKRAPEVADKSKKIAVAMVEKTEEAITLAKLKHKLHNLNRNTEKKLSELGGSVFELLSEGHADDMWEDTNVMETILSVKAIKKEIIETEQEIQDLGAEEEKEEQNQ